MVKLKFVSNVKYVCKIPQFKITNERCEYWCISCIVVDTDNIVK